MSSIVSVLSLALCLAVQGGQSGAAPKPSAFQGIWTGIAVIEGRGDDQVSLDLKVEKGVCTGTISDAMALIAVPAILNVKIEKSQLTFDITIGGESGTSTVHIELTLDGESLAGRWWNDQGETGSVKLTRKPAR
jgi:hypothetical protein